MADLKGWGPLEFSRNLFPQPPLEILRKIFPREMVRPRGKVLGCVFDPLLPLLKESQLS